jgi:hypothetical protein
VPLLIYYKKYNTLFALALFGFYSNIFNLEFGDFKFQIAAFATLCIIIIEKRIIIFERSIYGKFLWIEWFIMLSVGTYFVFIVPWDDPYEKYRLVTQQLPIRTLVGIIRFTELIFTFYFFVFVFKEGYVNLENYIQAIFGFILANFFIGLVDFLFLDGAIKVFLMPNHYAIYRFTGLMLEPRYIGQIMTLSIFSFIAIGLNIDGWKKYSILGIVISLIGVGLSFSSTAIVYLTLVLFIYFLLGKVKLKYSLIFLFVYIFGAFVLLNNDKFVEHQTLRIQEVGLELATSQIPGVPNFINRFEVFDRTALAFLYLNPQNIFLGVGPNTVNIPATKYMSEIDHTIYEGQINTEPFNFFVTVISRSGILGLIILLFGMFRIYKETKKQGRKELSNLFILFTLYLFCYNNFLFLVTAGIICGILLSKSNTVLKKLE